MMSILSKAYSIRPIRLLFKFLVCLTGVKIGGDFFYYSVSGISLTFPRYVKKFIYEEYTRIVWTSPS